MLHFGDITKISGFDAPTVDVIVGGSPCQDLSIAGKRAGLDGERSGLFMEQIRIIKEMRENDRANGRAAHDVRPRYMVWENVPGAFSSHKGEDFRIVLEETAKVADKDASIPMPDNGKWSNAGCVMGEGWSIAWRILDAQFWGVPQRRRRIALVADFGGQSASEILFVRKSVSGNSEPSKPQREKAPSNASGSSGADDREGGVNCLTPWDTQTRRCYGVDGIAPSLCACAGKSGQNQQSFCIPYTLKIRSGCEGGGKSACNVTEGKTPTLTCTHGGEPVVCYGLDRASFNQGANAKYDFSIQEEQQPTLTAKGPGAVCYSIGAYHSNAWKSDNPHSGVYVADTAKTLDAMNCGYPACNQGGIAVVEKDTAAVDARNGTENETNGALQSNSAHSLNGNNVVRVRYIVRRLTPMECERLQGYPDGWTDIGEYTDTNGKKRKSSDASRYKALGNSIALPPWKWVMKRISACYERDATLASLFDGIGGFPYIWEQINGKGSCLWASEIEEFCIAVTKERIG